MVSALFSVVLLGQIPLGEPALNVEFVPAPPWQVRPQDSLVLHIAIVNNGWYFAVAKSVRLQVVAPSGFTISGTNTNEWSKNLENIPGGERRTDAITIATNFVAIPGNYTIGIRVLGENTSEKHLNATIVVELPYIP